MLSRTLVKIDCKQVYDRWKKDDENYRIIKRLNGVLQPHVVKVNDFRETVQRRLNRPCVIDIAIRDQAYHLKFTCTNDLDFASASKKYENAAVLVNSIYAINIVYDQLDKVEWVNEDEPVYIALGVTKSRLSEYDKLPLIDIIDEDVETVVPPDGFA